MISKRSRKVSAPVENLKQSGFNGSKGIDINAGAESLDTVLLSKNFDIDSDGGLKLRKPVVIRKTFPEIISENGVIESTVLFAAYLFDNSHLLIIRKTVEGKQYVGIFKDSHVETFQITYASWDSEQENIIKPYDNFIGNYIHLPYIDFTKVSAVHTSSSTVLTGVAINIADSVFKIKDKQYSHADQTELFYPTLYDYFTDVWKYRTLTISNPLFNKDTFDIRIHTPDPTRIENSEDIFLNANLDADNPYAIRDLYNTTAPTIKSILPYVQCIDRDLGLEYLPDASSETQVFENLHNMFAPQPNVIDSEEFIPEIACIKIIPDSQGIEDGKYYFDVELRYDTNIQPDGTFFDKEVKTYKIRPNQICRPNLYFYTAEEQLPVFSISIYTKSTTSNGSHYFYIRTYYNIVFESVLKHIRYETDSEGFLVKSIFRAYYTLEKQNPTSDDWNYGTVKQGESYVTPKNFVKFISKFYKNTYAAGSWYYDSHLYYSHKDIVDDYGRESFLEVDVALPTVNNVKGWHGFVLAFSGICLSKPVENSSYKTLVNDLHTIDSLKNIYNTSGVHRTPNYVFAVYDSY